MATLQERIDKWKDHEQFIHHNAPDDCIHEMKVGDVREMCNIICDFGFILKHINRVRMRDDNG